MKLPIVTLLVLCVIVGCASAAQQAEVDGAHGFGHTTSLAECGQRARQAATNAGGGSKTAGGSDAGDVAAINAERECLAEMKDGGK